MINIDGEKLYTTQEAAEITGLTTMAIKYRMRKNPEIAQTIDGRYYIKAASLKEIVEGEKK